MTEHDDNLLELRRGDSRRLLGVRRPNGRCEAAEFLDALEPRLQNRFKALIDRLLEQGKITNQELFRRLQVPGTPAVWEFKVHVGKGWRLYSIQTGQDWLATHGGPKVPNKQVAAQAERARMIFEQGREQ